MNTFAVIAGLSLALPGTGNALALDQCGRGLLSHHVVETDHEDLGNGVVYFVQGGSMAGVSMESMVVVACHSGETLTASVYWEIYDSNEYPSDTAEYDYRKSAKTAFFELADSEEVFQLGSIGGLLGLPKENWKVHVSTEEVCACRAKYPLKRNGKVRFQLEP